MKKFIYLLLTVVILTACNRMTSEEKIENLSGYWQIETVEQSDGSITEFRFSELVEYIEIQDGKGFRKKMRPQLDGSYITSDDRENIIVKVENDSINLYYETPYNEWKETLISSEEEKIKILNAEGTVYTYKRFTPYSIDYGEEN